MTTRSSLESLASLNEDLYQLNEDLYQHIEILLQGSFCSDVWSIEYEPSRRTRDAR